MSDDASPDESDWADPDERDDAAADSDGEDTSDGTAVAPAVSTYAWSPAGGECAECGQTAEERWRADGEREGKLVCPDCKEW